MRKKQSRAVKIILDLTFYICGSLLYAIAINSFIFPNNIAPGGMTGVATMLQYLYGLPIGTMLLVLNAPLLVIGYFVFGFRFIIKTIIATVISSVMVDITEGRLPVYHGESVIVVVFGGALYGAGLALILMRGGTTGGTDLIASLISRRFAHVPMAKMILLINVAVVACSGFVYGNLESPMLAIIIIFIESKVIDAILYGTSVAAGKMLFIISKKNNEIAKVIMSDLRRGVTALKSRGMYSRCEGEVLLCAVHRQEITKMYHLIYKIDPDAFIIVGEAGQIRGAGFQMNTDPSCAKSIRKVLKSSKKETP